MYQLFALAGLGFLNVMAIKGAINYPLWTGLETERRYWEDKDSNFQEQMRELSMASDGMLKAVYVVTGLLMVAPIALIMSAFPGPKTFILWLLLAGIDLVDLVSLELKFANSQKKMNYHWHYVSRRTQFFALIALWLQVVIQFQF